MSSELKELDEYRWFMSKAELHKSVNSLIGILEGVMIDGIVNPAETIELKNWYEVHRYLLRKHPFNELLPVIESALEDNILEPDEIEDLLYLCYNVIGATSFTEYFDASTSKIQLLQGMIHGISADNVLTESEISSVLDWMNENDFLKGMYPFDEIYSVLSSVLADGIITNDEHNMLLAFLSTFIDTKDSYNLNEFAMNELQHKYSIEGICAISPKILISGKTFCFTGASSRTTRKEIAQIIEDNGGLYKDTITKATDYLVVGAEGNPCWAFSCYGRKVERAVSLRKEGIPIVLVNEFDFWNTIELR